MRAQITQRILLSLALGALLVSEAPAIKGCPDSVPHLLLQLQNLFKITAANNTLLEPYMQHQGLDISILRSLCKVCRGIFPREDALRALSRPSLLRTVHTTLGCIVRNLDILNQQLSKTKDAQNLEAAKWNVLGLQNNIHCMAWLLNSSLETPEPTPADTGTQPSWLPDPSQGTWAAKVAGLKFLYGYHSFMQAAGTVFREWGDSLSRSRRHSPRRHSSQRGRQHKGSRRTVSPRRVRGPGPQSWLPR